MQIPFAKESGKNEIQAANAKFYNKILQHIMFNIYCMRLLAPFASNNNNNNINNNNNNNNTSLIQGICIIRLISTLRRCWPRCLLTCMLLCAFCQRCECFHSSFKLSTNLVRTKYGLIRGIVVRQQPGVEAYLGIPYASPPMGSLRFMPPITPSPWKNVRTADRFSAVCPQTVPIPPNGPEALLEVPRARLAQLRRLLPLLKNQSEDCLYMNIYAPVGNRRYNNSGESDSWKLSTLLYIHGESYEWNSGNPYDGTELAAHGNIIVVTINFRLGIFGFLKTGGKESAQGNFGLMDLVAGLHWLKENLSAFGGNPQNITLLGHGSGAALANILAVSPVASDLLQRVVMVSGSALSPWALQKNPLFVKRRVAEQTGCHGDMLYDDLAPCLRTKTVHELLAVKIDHPRFLAGFAPFVDGTVISAHVNANDLTLPVGSTIVSTSGIEFANFLKRDLIFCLTSVESYLDLSAQDLEFGFNETRRDRILRTFVRNNYHYHLNEIFAVLKNEYTDWEKAIRNPLSARDATLAFLSDGHTASPLIKVGYMHSLRGGRAYFMHFKHKTTEQDFPQRSGSVRGEDTTFWLGLPTSQLFPYNYTAQEKQISRYMLHYLANFVKTGNPNHNPTNVNFWHNGAFQIEKRQVKRSSHKLNTLDKFQHVRKSNKQNSTASAELRKAIKLAIIYNQHRSNKMRNKREFLKRDASEEEATQGAESADIVKSLDKEHMALPFWDAYDVVNQLYLELGAKTKIQSHYRGHKLSMWLNLIPQLHKHANLNEQSLRHHQFPDHINNLYEGVVRPQVQIKPSELEADNLAKTTRTKSLSSTNKPIINKQVVGSDITGTECAVDENAYKTEITTFAPKGNGSLEAQKDLVTASTGIMGNLEVLRRLSSKQFQSYTTALIATVAVGFFLLILNVLIFAGIYHQREKRARDARTKEELEDKDTSKNSSLLKLNTVGLTTADAFAAAAAAAKADVIFSEYKCYDEKTSELKQQIPLQSSSWACAKPRASISAGSYEFPVTLKKGDIHSNYETNTFSLFNSAIDGSQPADMPDYAVQSSNEMCFKEIEAAVKASKEVSLPHDIDLDIPEPPPPPRAFHNMQQQQQQQTGILRQTGAGNSGATSVAGKKRVHIQEISV